MATTDLGACDWFVWDLRRSNLIDRGQLDQVVGEYLKRHPRAEPPALAEYLVSQKILTAFQSERILQGKTQGLVLGPYILMDAVGSGSMGTVYKAQSKTDNKWYAVKVLPRRSMWNVRLARRQVRAFEQFDHPSVVPFMDVGTAGGLHYLAWPFIEEGENLDTIVQRDGKVAPDVAAHYCLQIASGLNVCHQNGVFHGLVKPSNILIGADHQAHILDFGIGSLLAENEGESLVDTMSTANTLTSGLDCASPESIMEPTNRTPAGDQYSLGCILYYCLTGRYPFPEGSAVEKMMAHQTKKPTPVRELASETPEGLAAVCERLMAKTPEGRYRGCDEAMEALRPFALSTAAVARLAARKPTGRPAKMDNGLAEMATAATAGVTAAGPPHRPAGGSPGVPTRRSLRDSATPPVAASASTPLPISVPERPVIPQVAPSRSGEIPGMISGRSPGPTLEERLGPIGMLIIALLAGIGAWFAWTKFFTH